MTAQNRESMTQFNSSKILRHLDRVREWSEGKGSRPITYELDMTNICNSRCPFCFGFSSSEHATATLTFEQACDILRQVKAFGGRGVTFTGGGEPLCNAATPEAVRFARSIGLDVGFITNGIFLNENIADVIVDNCTWVRVSLDAGSPAVYQKTHGLNGDTFEKVVENTRTLVRRKKQRGSVTTIGTGFITAPGVTNDMLPYARISRDIGVDYAQFRPLLKKFFQTEINQGVDRDMLTAMAQCQQLSTADFHVLCSVHKYDVMKDGGTGRRYDQCHGHHFTAVISANRRMYLCCHMRGLEKYCIGDLAAQSLEDIWGSDRRKQVYSSIDFADCPLLCRCDGINTILWTISQEKQHENFL